MENQKKPQKPRRGRPPGSKSKKSPSLAGKGSAPLVPPVAPGPLQKAGLLSGVEKLLNFPSAPPPPPPVAGPVEAPPADSMAGYNDSSPGELGPLPEESARLLAAVPESIGGGEESPADGLAGGAPDPIADLMAQVVFEPQDVQDILTEFFDWAAERGRSEHWKLSDRQGRMLARPLAQLMDSCWRKLQNYLPTLLGNWCESTPGAMAFLLAAGLVIGPKVAQQMAISKARRLAVPLVRESAPGPVPVAAPRVPVGGGIVFE